MANRNVYLFGNYLRMAPGWTCQTALNEQELQEARQVAANARRALLADAQFGVAMKHCSMSVSAGQFYEMLIGAGNENAAILDSFSTPLKAEAVEAAVRPGSARELLAQAPEELHKVVDSLLNSVLTMRDILRHHGERDGFILAERPLLEMAVAQMSGEDLLKRDLQAGEGVRLIFPDEAERFGFEPLLFEAA